ncbi:hypothetical protein EVAR_25145_1 [Eumeta japonica]|uniref:Uncharacterized protein n=1 Tax=Eumeta variegata TaxID=151549 RepID=A0A4C1XLH5_EUMVA|nr:hypothetical protein EVAR_25145_1 [Eumeta japonica]
MLKHTYTYRYAYNIAIVCVPISGRTKLLGVANIVSQGREGACKTNAIRRSLFFLRIYCLFKWTILVAKYTGEFDIQFRLDDAERSWSTMQEIVPRNVIPRTRRPRSHSNASTPSSSYYIDAEICPRRKLLKGIVDRLEFSSRSRIDPDTKSLSAPAVLGDGYHSRR